MDAASLLLQQDTRRYESALVSWTQQVRSARSLPDAARLAAHAPQPGHLLRGVRSLVAGSTHRASTQVERHLLDLVERSDLAALQQAQRALPGHWPKVARAAQERMRLLSSPTP